MKRCSYCGAEYRDDTTECPIDRTPLGEVQKKEILLQKPTFAVISEHQIPLSLTIVSYLFFLPAVRSFGTAAFIFFALFFVGGSSDAVVVFLLCLIEIIFGIFFLCLSRGLRKCSRSWRIGALAVIWLGFIAMGYRVIRYFLTGIIPHNYTPTEFLLGYGIGFIVQVWVYRVLIRPDVRELFGV